MRYENIQGVPKFDCDEFETRRTKYCLLIPVINEGDRIKAELERAYKNQVHGQCDIIICDGGSTDGSLNADRIRELGVNAVLTKQDRGRQAAQLRMGLWWAMHRGYDGVVTIDGNNKDSIEDVGKMVEKLDVGYDFIQGSRYVSGGKSINTPILRHFAVRCIHAPIISLAAGFRFTDTTNGFRAYSKLYVNHPDVQPFRDIFMTYELLAYLSVRAAQLGLRVCEVPVTRSYPIGQKTPTKISPFKGNFDLIRILLKTWVGCYHVGR